MPELPEIETIKRTLEPKLIGQRILSLDVRRPDVLKHPGPSEFIQAVTGQQVECLSRRGKYLRIHMHSDSLLVVHLRMTGRLICLAPSVEENVHTHVIFHLDSGDELRFSDVRRFGGLWFLQPGELDTYTGMSKLGPEPFGEEFSSEYLLAAIHRRRCSIKQILLDQTVVAGLGNIYCDEVLFSAGIRPDRSGHTLTLEECSTLVESVRQVLTEAIQHRGTTFSDFLDGNGQAGENYPFLLAYQHGGHPCPRCGTIMEKVRIGGRSTCFCPACQR